jgi:hypothetical protein
MADYSNKDTLLLLEELRKLGVKSVGFDCFEGGLRINSVEFFPRSLLDVSELLPEGSEGATERPPPMGAPEEDGPPLKVPPAFANILRKRSVS